MMIIMIMVIMIFNGRNFIDKFSNNLRFTINYIYQNAKTLHALFYNLYKCIKFIYKVTTIKVFFKYYIMAMIIIIIFHYCYNNNNNNNDNNNNGSQAKKKFFSGRK